MSTLQQVALLMFLIFLPMGKGVFCNLLLFNIFSVHCISLRQQFRFPATYSGGPRETKSRI